MENKDNRVFTEIEIKASPQDVWKVFSDWDNLKNWSSSFIGISVSQPVVGEPFISYFKNPVTGGTIELMHVCTDYEEGVKFGWSGNLVGKNKDHHIYSIEATGKGTTLFKQEDDLHGPHSRFLNFIAEHKMSAIYKRFNLELKEQVEKLYPIK